MRSGVYTFAVCIAVAMAMTGCSAPAPVTPEPAKEAPKPSLPAPAQPKPAAPAATATPPAPAPKPAPAAPAPAPAAAQAPAASAPSPAVAPAPATEVAKATPAAAPKPAAPAKPAAPPKPKYKKVEWGENVLKNPVLGSWKKDKPADWSAYEFKVADDKQFAVKLGKVENGVSLPKPSKDKIVAISQKVAIDKSMHGGEVPVTFGVKYKSAAPKQLHLVLRYTANGKQVHSSQFPLPANDWTNVSKRIMLPAEAAEKGVEFFIMRQNADAGDVQIAEPFLKFGKVIN